MKTMFLTLAAAGALAATGAAAQTVSDTSLQPVNGVYGTSVATTTTTPTGTRTSVVGNDGGGANRASGSNVLNSWFQANVGPGSTVGITTDYAHDGDGSAYFSSTMGGNGKADLIYYLGNNGALSPVALSSLTTAAFDFYRDSASTTGAQFAPVLRLDILKNGAGAGSLVFENVYQNQANAPTDSWTTLTATLTSGTWWATNAALGPTFATAGGQKSLQAWIDANAGATLSVYGVEIGIGSGWNGTFFGAADDVNVAFSGGRTVAANFEVAPAVNAVPEPASWALLIVGAGGVGATLRRRRRMVAALA